MSNEKDNNLQETNVEHFDAGNHAQKHDEHAHKHGEKGHEKKVGELDQVVHVIEERHDIARFEPAKSVLNTKVKELEGKGEFTNYEELGVCYYYLLRIQLKSHLHSETDENVRTYEKMIENFIKYEKQLIAGMKSFSQKSEEYAQKQGEIKSFYGRMEKYTFALETIYFKKNFVDGEKRVYDAKMSFRQRSYRHCGRYGKWLEYVFLKTTCSYGQSFVKWGFTGISFAFGFAFLYYTMGDAHFTGSNFTAHDFLDYFYFSVVTFTTLGYGDIIPLTGVAKALTSLEVFFGYIMLGMFVSLLQKRI